MTSFNHTHKSTARRAILAGILGTLGFAAAASAQQASDNRTATVLPRNAAQSVPETAPLPIDSLKSHYAPAIDASAAAATTHLSYPYGVAVNPYNTGNQVYVTNLFGGVVVYNDNLVYQGEITAGVSYPAGVAVSFNQNIYVANNGGNNITIYNQSLTQVGTITDSTLASPISIYIDADDTVWVLDAAGVLHTYLSDGTKLPTTHTGGNTVGPWGPNVTVWGIADPMGGYDETYENRAQAVNTGPNLYNDYVDGSPGAGGEAQDQYGQEYVTDFQNNLVQIWSANGAYQVGTILTPGAPYGVAVDNVHNRVYVAMTTLNEVYVYSTIAPYKLLTIIH